MPAPKGVYYTKTAEEHPVYHLYGNCSEGEKIEAENLARAVTDRHLCKICGNLNPTA